MPHLIQLYIRHVAIGFGLAVLFLGALLALDIAGLRHLVSTVLGGWLALLLLVFFNGIVFGGVQFGIAIMRLERPTGGGKTARRQPVVAVAPARTDRL